MNYTYYTLSKLCIIALLAQALQSVVNLYQPRQLFGSIASHCCHSFPRFRTVRICSCSWSWSNGTSGFLLIYRFRNNITKPAFFRLITLGKFEIKWGRKAAAEWRCRHDEDKANNYFHEFGFNGDSYCMALMNLAISSGVSQVVTTLFSTFFVPSL